MKYFVLKLEFSGKDGLIVNPIALRKAKIVYNFGLFECNRVSKLNIKSLLAGPHSTIGMAPDL